MDVKIGTSGYSFEDWRGTFYPEKIEKGKMFDYYLKYFPTVEINSTYYRIPHPAVMANIEKKSPDGYEFIVKAPQAVTHKRREIDKAVSEYRECLKPMADAGKLKGVLAQFPFSFKFSQAGLNYLRNVKQAMEPNPVFVEFRHDSWVNRSMYNFFRDNNIGYVAVDEPQLRGLLKPDLFNTTDTAYIRLHGRNNEQWWDGGPFRYDYDYSEEELNDWKTRINNLRDKGKAKRLYIFFNNCHLGQAVKNAREMMKMLDL